MMLLSSITIGGVLFHCPPSGGSLHSSSSPIRHRHHQDALPLVHRLHRRNCRVCLHHGRCSPVQCHSRHGTPLLPLQAQHRLIQSSYSRGICNSLRLNSSRFFIFFSQLYKKFSNWPMQLDLKATKPPDFTFSASEGGNLTVFGDMAVDVVSPTNSSIQLAFVLGMVSP